MNSAVKEQNLSGSNFTTTDSKNSLGSFGSLEEVARTFVTVGFRDLKQEQLGAIAATIAAFAVSFAELEVVVVERPAEALAKSFVEIMTETMESADS